MNPTGDALTVAEALAENQRMENTRHPLGDSGFGYSVETVPNNGRSFNPNHRITIEPTDSASIGQQASPRRASATDERCPKCLSWLHTKPVVFLDHLEQQAFHCSNCDQVFQPQALWDKQSNSSAGCNHAGSEAIEPFDTMANLTALKREYTQLRMLWTGVALSFGLLLGYAICYFNQ